ncbi:hypothetical protein BU17DRAFT_36783 [Hysterangium stoloniferum]|nr:hypothetical protein BU17DRAFT_36783 [Hysterangium stoloniferum]
MSTSDSLYLPVFAAAKCALLITTAVSYRLGLRPPNPPPSKEDRIYYTGQLFESFTRLTPPIVATLCPYPSTSAPSPLHTLPLPLLSAISLLLAAALLRTWCYRTLGAFFTFEVTIMRQHKLITSGPYAYIRHPAYTGAVLILLAAAATCFLSPASYIAACGVMHTPARWWVYAWAACAAYAAVSLVRRGSVEDEGLRGTFGEEWERYREEVPWRFVPGLI